MTNLQQKILWRFYNLQLWQSCDHKFPVINLRDQENVKKKIS